MAKKIGLWVLAIIGLIFVFVIVKPKLFSTITSPITTPFVYDDYNFYENFLSGTINHASDWDIQDGIFPGNQLTKNVCLKAPTSDCGNGVYADCKSGYGAEKCSGTFCGDRYPVVVRPSCSGDLPTANMPERIIPTFVDGDGCQHWNVLTFQTRMCCGSAGGYGLTGCTLGGDDEVSRWNTYCVPQNTFQHDYWEQLYPSSNPPAIFSYDFGGLVQEKYYDGKGFPIARDGRYSRSSYAGIECSPSFVSNKIVSLNKDFGISDVKFIFNANVGVTFFAKIDGVSTLLVDNSYSNLDYLVEIVRSKVDSNRFVVMVNGVQKGEYSGKNLTYYWEVASNLQIKQVKYKMPFSCRLDADQLNVKMRFNEGSRVDINSFGVPIDKFCLGMPVIQRSYTSGGLQSTAEPYETLARGGFLTVPSGQYWELFGIVTNDGSLTQCGVDEAIVLTQSTCQTECFAPPCPSIPCGKPTQGCVKVGMTDVQCSFDSQCPAGYDCGSTGFCKAGKSILELEAQVSNLSLEVGYRGELIKNLSGTLTQQTEQLRLLKLSAEENAVIIKNMTKNFEEQTEIIKALRLNATENARLIDEMGGRIEEQGLRLKELNQTVEENAITIGIMTANVQDQKKLILALELNATENGILIANMQTNIADQIDLIEVLKTSQAEKELMIGQMLTEIQFQTNKINELNGIIEINGAMIASMDANIAEQLAVIDALTISLAEKEVLRIELVNKLNDANAKIAAMQVVVDQLGDDYESARAQILALSATLTNASDRITFLLLTVGELQLNNEEVANLLISYRARLGEDAILLNRLQSQNYNLSLIIHEYGLNLEKEKALVKQLNVSNHVLSEIVRDYENRLIEQQLLTATLQSQNNNLSSIIARYKDNLLSAEQTIGLLNQKNSDLIIQINKYKANLITEAELVRLLNISNAQLLKDINDYKNNLISEQQLSEKLKVTNAQLLVLVSEYETRLQAIAVYIKNLEKSNADALDIINKLQLSLSEKQDLIDYLNGLGKTTTKPQPIAWGWIVFGAIILIGGAYLLFKKK